MKGLHWLVRLRSFGFNLIPNGSVPIFEVTHLHTIFSSFLLFTFLFLFFLLAKVRFEFLRDRFNLLLFLELRILIYLLLLVELRIERIPVLDTEARWVWEVIKGISIFHWRVKHSFRREVLVLWYLKRNRNIFLVSRRLPTLIIVSHQFVCIWSFSSKVRPSPEIPRTDCIRAIMHASLRYYRLVAYKVLTSIWVGPTFSWRIDQVVNFIVLVVNVGSRGRRLVKSLKLILAIINQFWCLARHLSL